LYLVRQEMPYVKRNVRYDLEKAYKKALDDADATLRDIPRVPKLRLLGLR
jgi:hypothetical protein